MVEAAENDNSSTDAGVESGGEGLLAPLASNVYLVAGLIAAMVAGGALFWLATWTLYDYLPPFDDTLGAVLAETSRGLFIGAGLMGVLAVLRVLQRIGRRFGASR